MRAYRFIGIDVVSDVCGEVENCDNMEILL